MTELGFEYDSKQSKPYPDSTYLFHVIFPGLKKP